MNWWERAKYWCYTASRLVADLVLGTRAQLRLSVYIDASHSRPSPALLRGPIPKWFPQYRIKTNSGSCPCCQSATPGLGFRPRGMAAAVRGPVPIPGRSPALPCQVLRVYDLPVQHVVLQPGDSVADTRCVSRRSGHPLPLSGMFCQERRRSTPRMSRQPTPSFSDGHFFSSRFSYLDWLWSWPGSIVANHFACQPQQQPFPHNGTTPPEAGQFASPLVPS